MGLEGNTSNPVTRFNGLRVAQSILGTTIPIVIGQQRLSWRLLWYGAFSSKQAKQQGGSGLAKGGVQYVYSASVIGSVCLGNCVNFLAVWDSIGRYAMDTFSETTVVSGTTYTPLNQFAFKQDLGVGINTSYSVTTNDYGSPGSTTRTGSHYIPLVYTTNPSPAPGQYTINARPVGGGGTGGTGGQSALSITSVANASAGSTVYTGTITGGASNAYANYVFVTKGSNFPANNGQFTCTASTAATLTLNNPNGIADTAIMTALIIGSVPVYVFNAAQTGSTIVVNYTAYRYHIQEDELDVVPVTPFVITVQYAASYRFDNGVSYYPSGIALTATSGTPSTGQYNPNNGHYTFSVGDQGAGVVISYIYADPNVDNNTSGTINLTFFGGGLGQPVWSYLTSGFPSAALGYSELAYVASSGLYLGYSPVLPQYNFEILGPYSFGKGIPDANPADAIYGLLVAPIYKLNFPILNIGSSLLGNYTITGNVTSGTFTSGEVVKQTTSGAIALMVGTVTGTNSLLTNQITGPANGTGTWVGQTSSAVYTPTSPPISSCVRAMWSSNSFFISDILDSQSSLMNVISKWCEAGQAYISFDEGMLKFIPLSDTTSIGHGAVYSPPTQPIIDLDDNDFVVDPNKDPITIEQTPWQNRWNRVGVRWDVRSNDYNQDIYQTQDEAAVQQYGLMSETAQDYGFVTTLPAAQFAGNMRLQRYSAIYTTYKFTLKSNLAFLSPGDIITITDGVLLTAGTLFGRTPCRITKMVDDPQKGIDIEAENFPWSVGAALLYNAQAQLPSNTNDGPQEDPGPTTALIFEVPNRAAQFSGGKIYIFANGSQSNWGGAQVYVSFNGVDYTFYDQIDTPGRIGVTTADLPPHADPDNTDTLSVNMQQSGATLQTVTAADRDAFVTLSGIVSPSASLPSSTTSTAQTGANVGISTTTGSPGTQGPFLGTVAADVASFGSTGAWTNVSSVLGSSTFSQSHLINSTGLVGSDFLFTTAMGFNIPNGAGPILGLQVTATAFATDTFQPTAPGLNFMLAYRGGIYAGGPTFASPMPGTATTLTLGSSTDLSGWSIFSGSLLPAIVNDPTFGIAMQAVDGGTVSSSNIADIFVKNVKLTVFWQAAGSGAQWLNTQYVNSSSLFASAILTNTTTTNWIQGTDFGFQLPFGFITTGISVTIAAAQVSSPATATVQLLYNGQRIGNPRSASFLSTVGPAAQVSFGTSVDMWGIPSFTVDQINSQGPNGFGIMVQINGVLGDTIFTDNFRMTVYGGGTYALELVSYETATLTGLNTYNLTSLRRGVYGTYPFDHPLGAAFARLDQASFIYTVDPTFKGGTLYFKFLSFNAYGNQLQTLSQVTPVLVGIGGLAPGAFDQTTGAILQGTPNFAVPHIESALSAVHGSFGVQNIPYGYALMGTTVAGGVPQWTSIIADGRGSGSVVNLFVINVNANITALPWDDLICDTTSGNITVSFPKASLNQNTAIGVTKKSVDAHTVAITPFSGDTIQSLSTLTLSSAGDSVILISDGISNWQILADARTTASFSVSPNWWMSGDGTNYVWSTQLGRMTYGTANLVGVWMMRLPYAISVSKMNLRVNAGTGHAGDVAAYGMYDITGHLLFQWANIPITNSNTTLSTTITPVTLPPGLYWGAIGGSVATLAETEGGYTAPATSYTAWNSSGQARTGFATNPMSGGSLPSTMGGLTQNGLGSLPAVNMEA